MKTTSSFFAVGALAVLVAMTSAPSLFACPPKPQTVSARFTATDTMTGEFFDFGNYLSVVPDADGIVRIRGLVIGDLFTVSVPEFGISNLQLNAKMGINCDLSAADGTGESWGAVEGRLGGQLVMQGFWYGVREKKSDQLWLTHCHLLCVFVAGDLEGVLMKGTETIQTWSKFFETGAYGEAEGVLEFPPSFGLVPHRHHPPKRT
jgi:hypothetical protein